MAKAEIRTSPTTKSRTKRWRLRPPITGCTPPGRAWAGPSALRGQDNQETAVVVVGGEDIGDRLGREVALRVHRDALAERADPPLQRGLDGVREAVAVRVGRLPAVALLQPVEAEHVADGPADDVLVGEARELEAALPGVDHPGFLVADEEGGIRGRVVV